MLKRALLNLPVVGRAVRSAVAWFRDYRRDRQWRTGVILPVIIENTGNWDAYVAELSEPGLKNLKLARKRNPDVTYAAVPFSEALCREFMDIWERCGYHFPPDFISRFIELHRQQRLICFVARVGEEILCLHLFEVFGSYVRCEAPWYDTQRHAKRNLGTFMWFAFLEHALRERPAWRWIDLGGGPFRNLPADHYKRRFVRRECDRVVVECRSCRNLQSIPVPPGGLRGASASCEACGTVRALGWRDELTRRLAVIKI